MGVKPTIRVGWSGAGFYLVGNEYDAGPSPWADRAKITVHRSNDRSQQDPRPATAVPPKTVRRDNLGAVYRNDERHRLSEFVGRECVISAAVPTVEWGTASLEPGEQHVKQPWML